MITSGTAAPRTTAPSESRKGRTPVLVIAGTELRRIARDRTALFFFVLLPFLVIFIVGASVGGYSSFRVGLVVKDSGALTEDLVRQLQASSAVTVTRYSDEEQARTAVRRGERDAAVVIPAGFDATLVAGHPADVGLVTSSSPTTRQALSATLSAIIARQGARVQAAGFAAQRVGGSPRELLPVASELQADSTVATVSTEAVNGSSQMLPQGFGYSAPTMLVLFVFVNALAGGAALIQTRRLGIHARALASPVRPGELVLGEALCYVTLALLQSALIIGVGSALFGVAWGDPVAAATLVVIWALVGAGAGMLSGTVFRTEEQASAIGPAVGIALGMLGGCMWPLAIVAPVMSTIGHAAPQAWAIDAWTTLLSHDGRLADIAVQLLVLASVAVVLLALSAVRLRRHLLG